MTDFFQNVCGGVSLKYSRRNIAVKSQKVFFFSKSQKLRASHAQCTPQTQARALICQHWKWENVLNSLTDFRGVPSVSICSNFNDLFAISLYLLFYFSKPLCFCADVLHKEYYSASQKKQNPETMECCEQVVGCMTIIIYISWIMINMLSNDT